MILPTMNDDEKVYEAVRVTDWLCDICEDARKQVVERFKKGTRFPYFQRCKVKDDKNNEWTILFFCKSKEMKKKRSYFIMAYVIYDVPRKRKENDLNAGKGIMLFDPYGMRDTLRKRTDKRPSVVYDIVPHAFNRYTERYLKQKGLDNIEFARKVENMMTRWQWFDVQADMFGDKNAKKHANDGICPYDVVMSGGGLLRGVFMNEFLIRFNTYIDEDSMFDNQLERYNEMISEYHQMKREGYVE